jgi:hypothetical protein
MAKQRSDKGTHRKEPLVNTAVSEEAMAIVDEIIDRRTLARPAEPQFRARVISEIILKYASLTDATDQTDLVR